MPIDHSEKIILALAIGIKEEKLNQANNSFKFNLTVFLHQKGWLASRLVRWLLNIDMTSLSKKIKHYLDECSIESDRSKLLNSFKIIATRKWLVQEVLNSKDNKIKKAYQEVFKLEKTFIPETNPQKEADSSPPINEERLLVLPKEQIEKNILLTEAFFDTRKIKTQEILPLTYQWLSSPERQEGDYFIRPSTKTKASYVINVAQFQMTKVIRLDIVAKDDGYYLMQKTKIVQLTGSFDDLIDKAKQYFNVELKRPISLVKPTPEKLIGTEPAFNPQAIQEEIQDAEDINLVDKGNRTKLSREFLSHVKEYSLELLNYQDQSYTPISTGQIHLSDKKKRFVSAGSSEKREFITLDPNNVPRLDQHYNQLVVQLQQLAKFNQKDSLTISDVFPIINDYIRTKIFPSCTDRQKRKLLDEETTKIVNRYQKDHPNNHVTYSKNKSCDVQIPVISIEHFIKEGIGVCRHHGLVAAYLIDRLVTEHGRTLIPKGIVQQIRDNIVDDKHVKPTAHVWTTFVEENGTRWHIDTLWNIFTKFSEEENFKNLVKYYGKEAMQNQMKKTDYAVKALKNHLKV